MSLRKRRVQLQSSRSRGLCEGNAILWSLVRVLPGGVINLGSCGVRESEIRVEFYRFVKALDRFCEVILCALRIMIFAFEIQLVSLVAARILFRYASLIAGQMELHLLRQR